MEPNPNNSTNNRIATGLAIVITIAWAISFLYDIINAEYDPPASVHALMMIVAGAVFGEGLIRKRLGTPEQTSKKENEDARE